MTQVSDFRYSTAPEPHRERTRRLLGAHPEIRRLIGKNPATFWYTVGLVVCQVGIATLVREERWWLILALAYTVGAVANHALFVVIHECAHNLVFRNDSANTLTGILANLPHVVPSAVSFKRYHLKHHAFQGIYELDADLPYRWEARLVGRSAVGKALWLLVFPLVQAVRPLRIHEVRLVDRWTIVNWTAQIAFDGLIWQVLGPGALGYLLASLFFGIGLHPLGARWIQRHYLTDAGSQETHSYYGRLNWLSFNVGYHNEHHDFPSVPWNRLPEVKATAPELYESLAAHRSWTKLLVRFLLDRDLSLYSRMVRSARGSVRFDGDVTPDLDLAIQGAPLSAQRRARTGSGDTGVATPG